MLHQEIPVPLDPLTAEQEARIAQLTEAELNAIDNHLLSIATNQWRNVAMVVTLAMHGVGHSFSGVPETFYAMRLKELVAHGRLEAQGNLEFMRFSEVRLPELCPKSRLDTKKTALMK